MKLKGFNKHHITAFSFTFSIGYVLASLELEANVLVCFIESGVYFYFQKNHDLVFRYPGVMLYQEAERMDLLSFTN